MIYMYNYAVSIFLAYTHKIMHDWVVVNVIGLATQLNFEPTFIQAIERMQWAESTRPSAMLEDNLPPRPIRAESFVEHGQLLRCCRLF